MPNSISRRAPRSSYFTTFSDEARAQRIARPIQAFGTIELVLLILLPFGTGYFLSYYLRTVNAILSTRLTLDLGLNAVELGLITSAYFLVAGISQLPLGWALDRFGPQRVQSACLLLVVLGAILFSGANDVATLLIARSLMGLGVASALLAGLKALALACPRDRLGLFNGLIVSIGTAGAIAASAPTEYLLHFIDWRDLFLVVALTALFSATAIWWLVPRKLDGTSTGPTGMPTVGYRQIFTDRGFWKLAPLSATTIGGAWALQGLWSGPWLRDVMHFDQASIAGHLLFMAIALCTGALCFGIILHRLTRLGVTPAHTLSLAVALLIIAEIGLAFAWPVPPLLLWGIVSAFAAATVLTYTVSAQWFPKESVGRANSAFNLLQFGMAFAVQILFGHVVSFWPRDALGHYPAEAYRFAFLGLIAVQALSLLWFALPHAAGARADIRPPKPASRFRHRIPRGLRTQDGCERFR